jgi:hypothetical protein
VVTHEHVAMMESLGSPYAHTRVELVYIKLTSMQWPRVLSFDTIPDKTSMLEMDEWMIKEAVVVRFLDPRLSWTCTSLPNWLWILENV